MKYTNNFLIRGIDSLIKKIGLFFYAIPFGMKAANDEMLASKASSNTDLSGTHTIHLNDSIANDLLRGEVTQQVEDFRYSNYIVDRESTNYKYVGNGMAVKSERNIQKDKVNMGVRIRTFGKDVLTSMKDLENNYDSGEEYNVKFHYYDFPIYPIEKMAYYLRVIKTSNRNECWFYFDRFSDEFNVAKRKLISHLEHIANDDINDLDRVNKVLAKPNEIRFVTYKCDNEYDLVSYCISGLNIRAMELKGNDIIVKFTFDKMERIDLIDKYFSNEQSDRYANKEQKTKTYKF